MTKSPSKLDLTMHLLRFMRHKVIPAVLKNFFIHPLLGICVVGRALHTPASVLATAIRLVKMPVNRVRLFVVIAMLFAANCPANYWGYNGIVQNQSYQLEFTPRVVQNSTYWATMSVGSIGGYGGIQQGYSSNPATDHGGLFSIWDSTSTNADSFVIGFNQIGRAHV